MPPLRTVSNFKPVKTERTHEENQERAYIAASRRSDRSLEARVESARRASEIHKKRTGRSLRVREEDVMNEEMYEEEDDDLPMQYRRINALNPQLSYAFAERLNNYINGQIGVRTALQQAIQQSNQYTQNQQLLQQQQQQQQQGHAAFNPMSPHAMPMPHSTWPINAANNMPQHMRLNQHHRSMSLATPQEMAAHYQAHTPPTPHDGNISPALQMSTRHLSPSAHSASAGSPYATSPASLSPSSQKKGPSSLPTNTAPGPLHLGQLPPRHLSFDSQMAPLTTSLPNETIQLLGGMPNFEPNFFPVAQTSGQTTPNMGKYSYNPNAKSKPTLPNGYFNYEKPASTMKGLNQTLTQPTMNPNHAMFYPTADMASAFDPQFHPLAPFDHFAGLGEQTDLTTPMTYGDFNQNSGLVTPNDAADNATFVEFFDFQNTPE